MPELLDLGDLRVDEGYFLLNEPVVRQRPFAAPQSSGTGWRFCSTFRHSTNTLREEVLGLIRAARRKVFVTSFILGDDELIKALVEVAQRGPGGVYVISELSEASLRRGLAQLEDKPNVGQKVEAEKKRFTSLTSQGVAVRGHENCHAKFVVIDDVVAWVGSANLETRAFTEVGEVGVVTDDPAEVDRLARLFAQMWLSGCKYELPGNAADYTVKTRAQTPAHFSVPVAANPASPALIWTNDQTDGLRKNLRDVIGQARHRLRLATFSLNRMEERPDLLLEPVAQAIERGASVEMLVRAMNKRDRHRRDAGLLHDLGVRVVADDLNHAKAATADDAHGMLFSANFDAEHGLDVGSGIEIGARLDGTPALAQLDRYLQHAMACATRRYVPSPTNRELNAGLNARWQSPWPLPQRISIRCDRRAWVELLESARTGPALWTRLGGNSIELLVGSARYELRPRPGDSATKACMTLTARRTDQIPASRTLANWWRDGEAKAERGFCPGVLTRPQSDDLHGES